MRLVVLLLCLTVAAVQGSARVVCYWDGESFWREGMAKVTVEEIKPGIQYCSHLIYGYAGLDDYDYTLKHLDENLVLDYGHRQYKAVVDLKSYNPSLKVMLAIGGFGDNGDNKDLHKYLEVLESGYLRANFIESVSNTLREYNFDGVDLVWRFPEVKEIKDQSILGAARQGSKRIVGIGVDDKWAEHKDQFVRLVQEMKNALRPYRKQISIGVIPHVDASAYYKAEMLCPHVDFVNLWTFDFRTPERSKVQADYTAPLFFTYDRDPQQNAEAHVKWWRNNGCDPGKLNLGVPTYGRSWKLTANSLASGKPPLLANGAGDAGPLTKTKGKQAYYETCTKVVSSTAANVPPTFLRRFNDDAEHLGTFAYRPPKLETGEKEGMWLSFEEPETAAYKAAYVKSSGLGGVAVVDMSLDDARGFCDGPNYPILRSIKKNL